ncbi:MAG: FecR family protein [Acidobacteriia bacterium]|nr:FecR family protein [Terriglobia bacterium]
MKRLALATSMIATALTVWAQQFPGAPEYPQGDPRSPQGNQGVGVPDNGPDDAQADAPDRGVARISFMNGNVSVRRGDSGDMVAAIVNAPLTIGDRLVTADGRAEVQFDSANMIRLGPASEVRFSELQYHRYQIQVAAGTVSFRVLRDSDAQVEISTPSISLRPVRRGIYRIDIHPDGTTGITLRAGADGEVFGPRGSEPVHNNSTMLVRGSGNDPEFQVTGPAPEDEFDRWAASRDAQLERAVAPRYVPRDVYGAEDLDGNGRWVDDGSYGQVWQPTGVDPDWAPYRCGRWVWMDYYGWTWVGCESWGWAPYHYGRWYYGSYGWCWWPGPLSSRYYWRPALVGFFGWGGGVGFGAGFGFGNVGWVPLAPFERFHPWYGRGYYGGYRGATVVNNINVTNVYRNARYSNGITSMHAGEFGHGSVSSGNFVRASAGDLRSAGAVRGQLPFQPSRESTRFTSRSANMSGAPRTTENARFFSRTPAASVNRVPFEQQRQSFSNPTRSPVSPAGGDSRGGFRNVSPNSSPNSSGNGGWQRATPSGGQGTRPQSAAPSNGGWQRLEGNPRSNPSANPGYNGGYNRGNGPSPSQPQARPQSQPQSRGGYSPSQAPSRNYSPQPRSEPQQLRINPPILQNRGNSGGGGGGSNRGPSGGGSAPRSSGGGAGSHGGGGGGSRGGGGGRH